MTALGKLLRTTAFRLTLVYLALFALFAALLLFFLALNARRLISEEITTTVNREVAGLNDQYERGGIISRDLPDRPNVTRVLLGTTATDKPRGDRRPAVLVECGFLSNREEAARLASAQYQQVLAEGVAEAVIHYFNADAAVGNL